MAAAVRYRTVVVLVRRVQCVSETGSCRAPKIRVSDRTAFNESSRTLPYRRAYVIRSRSGVRSNGKFAAAVTTFTRIVLLFVNKSILTFAKKGDFFFLFRRSRPCVTSFFWGVYFRGVVCSFSLAHFGSERRMSKEEEGDRGTLFRSLFSSIEEKTKMEEGIIALRQIFTTLKIAFFGRFSSELAHAPSHALSQQKTAHKMPFVVIFTKNTFSIA